MNKVDKRRTFGPRVVVGIVTAFIAAPLGALFASFGYGIVVCVLEVVFVPPLTPLENFGQFGVLLVFFGFFGLLLGASYGVIPLIGLRLWLLLFMVIVGCMYFADSSLFFDWSIRRTVCVAQVTIGMGFVVVALLFSKMPDDWLYDDPPANAPEVSGGPSKLGGAQREVGGKAGN